MELYSYVYKSICYRVIRVDRLRCQWKADTFWSVWFLGASVVVVNTCPVCTLISRNSYPGSIKLWVKWRRDSSSSFEGCALFRPGKEEEEEQAREWHAVTPKVLTRSLRTFAIVLGRILSLNDGHFLESDEKHNVWYSLIKYTRSWKVIMKNYNQCNPMIGLFC